MQFRGPRPWLHSDRIFNLMGYGKIQDKLLSVLHGQSEAAVKRRKKVYYAQRENEKNVNDENNNGNIIGE